MGAQDQLHAHFLRRAAPFADVASDAGADDVFPTHFAAAAARQDVIEAELAGRKDFAAILAVVAVAGEQVATVEAERLPRHLVVRQQTDNAQHWSSKLTD